MDFLKRLIFLDRIIRIFDQVDTGNKADVRASNRADTRGNNGISMTMRPNSEDKVVTGVKNKMDIRLSYRLNSFILVDDHVKNLFF